MRCFKITKQITIKLNERRFDPLFKLMQEKIDVNSKSNSEFVGWCVYFCYRYCFEKIPEFGNQTAIEFNTKKRGMNVKDAVIEHIKKYNEFIAKDGH